MLTSCPELTNWTTHIKIIFIAFVTKNLIRKLLDDGDIASSEII